MADEQKQSSLSPKISFVLGLVTGLAIFGLVAFGVVMIRGGESNGGDTAGTQPTPSGDPTEPAVPDGQPQDVTMAAVTEKDHLRGPLDAPVKIGEYSDFECPFCKRFHETMKQLKTDYGDKVTWVYRHFPLLSLHTQALKEAEAAECVADLGGNDAFWKFTDKIYEVSPGNDGLDLKTVPDLAASVGVDKAKFQECWDSGKYTEGVKAQYQDAITAGAQGTPFNVIIGPDGKTTPLAGAYPIESFKQIIDPMLASVK